jgi:hypothetical protein
MTHSITSMLSTAIILTLAMAVSAQAAKVIPGQNIKTFAAACDRAPKCINWGGGHFSNDGTNVTCNEKKCVNHENTHTRTGSGDNPGNDPSGSTVNDGGGKGDTAGGAGGNPGSMGGDNGPSID